MKRFLTILMCLLAVSLLAGCSEGQRGVAWVGGDNEASFVRLGAMVTENNEVGVLSNYYPNERNDSQGFGIYAVHHIPGEFEIPNPITGEPIMAVCSYIGVQTTFDDNYDDQLSAFTGVEFWDIFFAEVQFDAYDNKASVRDDEVRGVLGARIKF